METPEKPDWLGSFKGAELSFLQCEALAVQHLEPGQLVAHWETQDTIWFDYARLHPVKAIYHFAHVYGDAFGRYLGENIEHSMRYSRGLKGDVLQHREIRSLLALKREADKRGIPYPIWIERLFKHFGKSGWTRPPRPAHMLKAEEGVEEAVAYWSETVAAKTVYAKDPWFKTAEWVGHEQQSRYERWVINNVMLRPRREVALSSAVYEMDALRIEAAVQNFSPDIVNQAMRWRASQISNG